MVRRACVVYRKEEAKEARTRSKDGESMVSDVLRANSGMERFTCLDIGFRNNDQLKINTALHTEAAKIEFKAI